MSSITGRVKSKTVKLVYAAFLLSTSLLWSKSNDWLDRNQDNFQKWVDMSTRELLLQ
jgi:hypothetical protein